MFTFSEDQEKVYDALENFLFLDTQEREFRLGGLAGTGKTTLVGELLKSPCAKAYKASDIHIATFTGKAAERLLQTPIGDLEYEVTTLHKLLFEFRVCPVTKKLISEEKTRLPKIIIIDEASMVPEYFYKLLLKPYKGVEKVLFVGDHGQLPPIAKEGETPFNLMENPHMRLEKIHRQCEGSEIISLAYKVRNANSLDELQTYVRESSLLKLTEDQAILHSQDTAISVDAKWEDIVHIVYTNKARTSINQTLLKAQTEVEGSPIICLQNMSDGLLSNGSRGILKKVEVDNHHKVLTIVGKFPLVGTIAGLKTHKEAWLNGAYQKSQILDRDVVPMDFAFAITCHKAQGCGWPFVYVWLSGLNYIRDFDLLKRWLYTAITRSESHLAFVLPK